MTETRLGKVKHFFSKISVAIVVCESDGLAKGETLHIKGHTTDVTFKVESLQVQRDELPAVEKGKDVAVKVPSKVRADDIVFKVKE
jgi:putative protease